MYHHHNVRKALRRGPAGLTPAAFRLGCAVWEVNPSAQSHARCLSQLPSLVEAEWRGQAGSEYRSVRRHLQICKECGKIYLELTEFAAQDAGDQLPQPASIPPPTLSFLGLPDA